VHTLAAIVLGPFIMPLGGCSLDGSGGSETVDIARAKTAASANPDIAKAGGARGKSGIGEAQTAAGTKGRK
jgi:hypothetical protein